jgi:flagellar biosynthesis protein FlhG
MILAQDQGATLRKLSFKGSVAQASSKVPPVRSLAVTSGKGGVGKTSLAANLACLISEMGRKVLLFDADMGLANVDVLFGLNPQRTIRDFLEGRCLLREIVTEGPSGISIVPGGSGQSDLTHLTKEQRLLLYSGINLLGGDHDLLLIDTAAGVSQNVLQFNAMAERLIVIVTPEPTSITDAYAVIKLMFLHYRRRDFLIVVNNARSPQEAHATFEGLNRVVETFLKFSLKELGWLPWDGAVMKSVRSQRPFVHMFPEARATSHLREIAIRIMEMAGREDSIGGMTLFGPYA